MTYFGCFIASTLTQAEDLNVQIVMEQPRLFLRTSAMVTLSNLSQEVIIVDKVESDCSCFSFTAETFVLEPGAVHVVDGYYNGLAVGPFNRQVRISYLSEDGLGNLFEAPVSGEVTTLTSEEFIKPETLAEELDQFVIWDLRSRKIFDRVLIQSAAHMVLDIGRIPTTDRPIVLVTESYPSPEAMRLFAHILRASEEQVVFLQGGMAAWAAEGLPTAGIAPEDLAAYFVPPEQVVGLRRAKPIIWSTVSTDEIPSIVANFDVRPWSNFETTESVKPAFILTRNGAEARVMIEASQANNTLAIQPAYIWGGVRALEQAIHEQDILRLALENSSTQRVVSSGHGTTRTIQSMRKLPGCSTCPN